MAGSAHRLGDLLLVDVGLLLDLADVDVSDSSLVTIDDLGKLLKGGALGLNVHEVHEAELEEDPDLRVGESAIGQTLLSVSLAGQVRLTV